MTVQHKILDEKPSPALQAVFDRLAKARREGTGHRWEDFSFEKSQELLKDFKGSLSDAVIEEREEYR